MSQLVNGVFMGGGAKGLAYAGALDAVHERGYWFGSVAGASAGAITAVLIAAGLTPDKMRVKAPQVLAATTVPAWKAVGKAVIGRSTSLYDTKGMRRWLDQLLTEQCGVTDGRPVTFDRLYAAFGIELYIVAMDLADGLPIVFNRRTTPTVEVANAVAASCAIPGAFPAGRGVWYHPDSGATVHQLVDGGTWANYPAFVFRDQSFRAWVRAVAESTSPWDDDEEQRWSDEQARPFLGFVLGEPTRLPNRQVVGLISPDERRMSNRFDQGSTTTSGNPAMHAFGAVLSNDIIRFLVMAAAIVLTTLGLVHASIMIRRTAANMHHWLPDWTVPFALMGMLSLAFVAALTSLAVVMMLVVSGRLIAETLLPSMRSLISVPTGVPAWVGLGADGVVLQVPHGRLETVSFAADPAVVQASIAAARAAVLDQLDEPRNAAVLPALLSARPPTDLPPVVLERDEAPDTSRLHERARLSGLTVMAALSIIGLLAWIGIDQGSVDRVRTISLTMILGLGVGGFAVWYLASSSAARAMARARTGVGVAGSPVSTGVAPRWLLLSGAALLAAASGLSMWGVAAQRDERTVSARLVEASTPPVDANEYEVELPSGERATLVTERHLRMHEHVFVTVADGDPPVATLVGPVRQWQFPVAIVFALNGVALVSAGALRRRWRIRNRRLAALVTRLHLTADGTVRTPQQPPRRAGS